MCYRLIRLQALLLTLAAMAPVSVNAEAPFTITASPSHSNDGKVVVSWQTPALGQVHIQQDRNHKFETPTTRYIGHDGASVVTGLVDGAYHYRGRLEAPDGTHSQWSPIVKVTVEHHSLARAISFFLVGLVVFVATLLLIIVGARRRGTDA